MACIIASFFWRVVSALPTTEKVLAKCGQNGTKSSISTERSKLLFRGTKLQKKCGTKSNLRLNVSGFSIIDSAPLLAIPCACCTTQIYKKLV